MCLAVQPSSGRKHHPGLNTDIRPTAGRCSQEENWGLQWQTLSVNCQRLTCARLTHRKFSSTTYFTLYAKWWNVCIWVETCMMRSFARRSRWRRKIRQWFDEWFHSGTTGTPLASRRWAEHERTQQGTAFCIWLLARCLIIRASRLLNWGSERRHVVQQPRIAAFQVALGLIPRCAFPFANVLSALRLFLRCCSDIKAASGGIQPR